MGEERPIRFNLLNKDELIYEVAIRDEQPASTVDKLRVQIRTLVRDIPTDELIVFEGDADAELRTIDTKLTELEGILGESVKGPIILKKLNRFEALGNHLFHRLSRVEPTTPELQTFKTDLHNRLLKHLHRIDNMTHTFSSSFDFKSAMEDQAGVGSRLSESNVHPVVCDRSSSVASLNIKFNGRDSVHAFLQRVEELACSRSISATKLFNSAAELFVEEALFWFRGVRSELTSWDQLKSALLEEFLPYDYDHRLLEEIRSRTQGPEETISSYLNVMLGYFSRLGKPLTDGEKLDIVKFNIRPFYSLQLANHDVRTWADLKSCCRKLEAAKQRADNFTEPPKNKNNSVASDLSYKGASKISKCQAVAKEVERFCVQCRVKGHSLSECSNPRVKICYRCGEKDVTVVNCPKCSPKRNSTGTKNE